jgi:hypothetical protein
MKFITLSALLAFAFACGEVSGGCGAQTGVQAQGGCHSDIARPIGLEGQKGGEHKHKKGG